MTIKLRRATSADTQRLFAWRNDAETRASYENTEPVAWEDYVRWVSDALARPDQELWIAERDGKPAGIVKIDHRGPGVSELNYMVAPENRGQGIGTEMVRLAVTMAGQDDLLAVIKAGNEPSIRIVRLLGFTEIQRDNGLLIYKRFAGRKQPD